jgi:hypothetical protein
MTFVSARGASAVGAVGAGGAIGAVLFGTLAGALGLLAFGAGSALAASGPAHGPWELVRSDEGIIVHRRTVAGSSLHEFRGVGVVRAPIAAVLGILNDAEHRTEWMKEAAANVRVEQLGPYSEIFYSRTKAPWPVSDRDVVNLARTTFDVRRRSVRLDFHAVSHPAWPPQKGVVRMPSLRGHWTMWPEQGGAWTRIEYQLHADPGGWLPTAVVNLVSRQIPHSTLTGMRRQLGRRRDLAFEERLSRSAEYRAIVGLPASR